MGLGWVGAGVGHAGGQHLDCWLTKLSMQKGLHGGGGAEFVTKRAAGWVIS